MGQAVLIVDDDDDVRETLAEFFRVMCSVPALTACNAKEGIEIFRANPEIGAIVSDYQMGGDGLNGDHLHRELAGELQARRVYFVLVHGGDQTPRYFEQLDVMIAGKPVRDPDEFAKGVVEGMRSLQATA